MPGVLYSRVAVLGGDKAEGAETETTRPEEPSGAGSVL